MSNWFDRLEAKVDIDLIFGGVGYLLILATIVALVRGCT